MPGHTVVFRINASTVLFKPDIFATYICFVLESSEIATAPFKLRRRISLVRSTVHT